ncbi:MAG: hypothetical protein ABIJ97_16000 [Bacteroidota bacterium]
MAKRGRKKKEIIRDSSNGKIKVRLDYRTVITIRNLNVFKLWKEKYPEAEIIA